MCDEAQCMGGKGGRESWTEGGQDSVSLPCCRSEAFVALIFLRMSYGRVHAAGFLDIINAVYLILENY